MPSQTVSFIGPGIMGKPMALNLLKGGHRVFAYARRAAATAALVEAGATACASCSEAAAASDFCVIMVSDTPDVEEILFADAGVIHGARDNSVVIVMSTISPQAIREMARRLTQKNLHLLDAPVSGGDQGAIAGTLSIMVGGEETVFQRALPLLECMGKNIVHVGASGAGQVAKLCNNLVAAQTISAVAEAFEFARAAGVDRAHVRTALLGGFAYSRVLELHGQRMLNEDYAPGFKAKLHLKDMNIAADTAATNKVKLPGTDAARELLEQLVNGGDGDLDSSAIAKVVAAATTRKHPHEK